MKNYLNYFYVFLVLLITGCTSDSTDDTMPDVVDSADEITLSTFEIEFEDVTQTSATILWSEVTASNESTVDYSIFLNEELVAENLTELEFTVDELEINTIYTVKISASAENAVESINSSEFQTLGTPPSSFPITYKDNGCGIAFISWDSPTVEDGSDYSYRIYLNGEHVETYGSYSTERTGFNLLVAEGEDHVIKVIAASFSGAETEEEITFTQVACPIPSDFEITASNITGTSATLNWTASTMSDDSTVYYLVTANGVGYPAANTFIYRTDYEFTNLERNTTYEVIITARAPENGKTKESTITFTTTNDYPVHPDISVTEATLITPDSQYFPGQLNVTFSEELANFEIEKWVAVDYEIANYSTYTSSVSSSVLSEENYNSLEEDKTGYFLIEVDGVLYQLNYDVVLETN
ncbi:fibronectin type III domain-containing protein [Maribacter sp. SA7]|uniref:fibronectin type III domain-containing protein n=1 Tax=Maribacter zhoushanensis TaxID=3030012 RepID=UPI0023EE0DEE|nr:fibronectin type III domain-containing protein [Maribacter zhoushanensis]MDF4201440.1 fibronectin type III domain-containing protein [Maribacter zhoushanensis]